VVGVAGLGRAGAPREDTGQVPFGGLVGEPVGDLVLVHVQVRGQVEHRLDRDLHAGDTAPGADLLGVHERAGVRHPGQVQPVVRLSGGAGDRVLGEVHVQDHFPTRRSFLGAGVEVK